MQTQHNKQTTDGADDSPERMQIGLRRGVRCYFDVDGITISVWASAWTGREVVCIDDAVVSDRRSFRMSTRHEFEHKGLHYAVVIAVTAYLQGRYEISLFREGQLIDSDTARFSPFSTKPGTDKVDWLALAGIMVVFAILGAVVGFVTARWLVSWVAG